MAEYDQIDIHNARDIILTEEPVVVDIRDQDSFSQGHLQKAISLNNENLEQFVETTDKQKVIICYCYHGMSSQMIAQYLRDNGFEKVYSMIGGFEQWRTIYPNDITCD